MRFKQNSLIPITYYARGIMDLLFPSCCAGCKAPLVKSERWLCTFCMYTLPETNMHKDPYNEATRLLGGQVPLTCAICYLYFHEQSTVQQIVHHFKYLGMKEVGRWLGNRYGKILLQAKHAVCEADFLVPVPIQPNRLRKRGYNQSELFAQGLADQLGIEVFSSGLSKVNNAISQVGKGRFDRFTNLEDMVEVRAEGMTAMKGKHIVIVDDVLTTGATVISCAQAVLSAGASEVSILTLARKRN